MVLDAAPCAGIEPLPGGHVEYASGAVWTGFQYDAAGVLVSTFWAPSWAALRTWIADLRAVRA